MKAILYLLSAFVWYLFFISSQLRFITTTPEGNMRLPITGNWIAYMWIISLIIYSLLILIHRNQSLMILCRFVAIWISYGLIITYFSSVFVFKCETCGDLFINTGPKASKYCPLDTPTNNGMTPREERGIPFK